MWGNYDFEVNEELLLSLEITSSFAPTAFFKITKNKNNDFIVYWRKELKNNNYLDKMVSELNDIFKSVSNLKEIYQTSEYKSFLNKYSPINKAILNDYQKLLIINLTENGLNKDVHIPCGRDGHSYHLTLYYPEPEMFHFWYILPKEWTDLKFVIDFLVREISNLDYSKYGVIE